MQQLPIPLFDGHDLYNWSHTFVTKCEGCKEMNPKEREIPLIRPTPQPFSSLPCWSIKMTFKYFDNISSLAV